MAVRSFARVRHLFQPLSQVYRPFYGREAHPDEKVIVDRIKIQAGLSDEFGRKYKWCKAPSRKLRPLQERKTSENDVIKDWNDALGTVINLMVVPELADQLSGAIYMHSIPLETQTNKCEKLADTVDELHIPELAQIVETICLWPSNDYKILSDTWASDALQRLLESIDQRCLKELRGMHEDFRWNLVFNFCRISQFYKSRPGCRVPEEMLKICSEAPSPETKEEVIRLLLLAGFCHDGTNYFDVEILRDIDEKVMELLNSEELTINELSCCFTGTFSLGTPGFDKISQILKSRYGFRLH